MTLIVKTITRLTVGLILVYGIFIIFQGQISPGGGFAGGLIVALSFIHLILAFGKDAVLKKLNQAKGLVLMAIGALLFLSLAAVGLVSGNNPLMHAESPLTIIALDLAIALLVASGLYLVFLVLVLLKGEVAEK